MKRFLAIIRRIFLGGVVSLLCCIFLLGIERNSLVGKAMSPNNFAGVFSLFFVLSPLLYLLFVIISVAYIRKYGQFAVSHQAQSPIVSFFRCIGHDLVSPFVNLKNFFYALFKKNEVIGCGVIIRRFIGMVVLALLFIAGMGSLL